MFSELWAVGKGVDIHQGYSQAFYHSDHTYQRGVRAVILFNQERDTTLPGFQLNWSPTQSPRATGLVASELARRSAM